MEAILPPTGGRLPAATRAVAGAGARVMALRGMLGAWMTHMWTRRLTVGHLATTGAIRSGPMRTG